jgi:photosystem II stability/assembly factor-like uncharacterized protein/lysophospholipase L1-like esterase
MRAFSQVLLVACGVLSLSEGSLVFAAEAIHPRLYSEMRWRMIGPFRGGRTVGATGVPGQPNVFYIGVNNGGVWKTTDYGHTWKPIFDEQPTGSIGALAVAPSKPEVIYVGSGEGLQRPDLSVGDGVYKSPDGGKTWKHLGLRDGQQIPAILVDPRDPDRVFVAVLGHPYGANAERGVFRSSDGGKSWEKVLYKDENTGAVALAFDPSNARTIYAALWSSRQGPWENGAWQGSGSGLYKSTDGGSTWQPLTKGLPTANEGLGRIGIDIAPSDPKRMYALVDARQEGGLYRSDDAGASWKHINSDRRVWGRGSDFAEIKVDPKNKDIVYSANITLLRSTDGGQSFKVFKGAPGGDDYHTVWINPDNPKIILTASDQGAVITANGGQTWSSWYNQPTAQFYHVITDNQFPYWVYGGQQESGSAGVISRGRDGQITFRDWHPVGVEEYGYVAPDPLNPNLIYGGKVTRFDRTTGQVQHVGPEALRTGKYRFLRTAPLVFSTVDPHVLYLGANVLFKTTSGGNSWDIISPDLSREAPDVPANIGIFRTPQLAKQPRRGVIYTVAPSYKDANVIWCGTDDGLIHFTRDGGQTWSNVTPPEVTSWSKISILDAGQFDAATAYAAVNRIRLDDLRPHIYRTHDGGKTWTEIVKGLPACDPVNTVREDPIRKGLLFAGTERAVYVSFNDGDDWQPLRLNMPATSIRDLVVHNDDVVVGTHGRSFWILDDITPLRQMSAEVAAADAFLFKPQLAYRVRNNLNTDTPLPPEEPGGKNPPDGAILNYFLKADAKTVALEIFDQSNKLVRRYASTDKIEPVDENALAIPTYWIRPPQIMSAKAGMHRFIWDLHYSPLEGMRGRSYGMAAVYRDTPAGPFGPWVQPGEYQVKLTVDGRSYTQPLTVKMDPRVKTPAGDLEKQFQISMRCYEDVKQIRATLAQTRQLRDQLKTARERAGEGGLRETLADLDRRVAALEGTFSLRGRPGMMRSEDARPTFARVSGELSALMNLVQGADMSPTTQAIAAFDLSSKTLAELLARWTDLKTKELPAVNGKLRQAKLSEISLEMEPSGSRLTSQPPAKQPDAAPAPMTLTAQQDRQLMLDQLKIPASKMRSGPSGMNPRAPNYQNTDEAKANPWPHLPEMMVTKSRQPVTTPELWWSVRRPELVEYFDAEVYGRVPPNVPKLTWEVAPADEGGGRGFGGRGGDPGVPTITKRLIGRVDNSACPAITVNIQLRLILPAKASGPVPVMMDFGGGGGMRQYLAKGWGYAFLSPASIQADNGAGLTRGIIGLVNKGQPRKPEDWGSLRAWAWGASRALDYLETDKAVDARRVGISGLSRYGKAALVAMAYEPRFAIGLIGSSGEGGAKLHRRNFGEQVENLTGSGEYHWMAGSFLKYGGPLAPCDLPVDAHELIALCAPRPVFISYGAPSGRGAEGTWVDQRGSFMAAVAAGPAYRLLGKKDLGTSEMPPAETALVDGELAWRMHKGGHTTGPNLDTIVAWAARYLSTSSEPTAPAPATKSDSGDARASFAQPRERTDANSRTAHRQLLEKAAKGRIDIYFAGDSITRRWGATDYPEFLAHWNRNFHGWNAGNFGWGGDRIANILWRLHNGELDRVNPKIIVVMAGTNDVSAAPGASDDDRIAGIARGIRAILDVCRQKAPESVILLMGITPRNDKRGLMAVINPINERIARLADGKKIRYLNINDQFADRDGVLRPGLSPDGLHFSVKGYEVWANALKPIFTELLGPPAKEDLAPQPTGDPSAGRKRASEKNGK